MITEKDNMIVADVIRKHSELCKNDISEIVYGNLQIIASLVEDGIKTGMEVTVKTNNNSHKFFSPNNYSSNYDRAVEWIKLAVKEPILSIS